MMLPGVRELDWLSKHRGGMSRPRHAPRIKLLRALGDRIIECQKLEKSIVVEDKS